jgi:hypothetical protein
LAKKADAMNYDDVTALGQHLASALDEHDFLGRWMSHYVAEVLAKSDREIGQARDDARREAFDVILQLWERRRDLPAAQPPLQSFDHVFATLDRLSDNTPWSYFDLFKGSEGPTSGRTAELDLLDAACTLDADARNVVRLAVAVAGAHAAEADESWTSVARALLEDDHQRAIRWMSRIRSDPRRKLVDSDIADDEFGEVDPVSLATQRLIEAIDRMIETLVSTKEIALEGGP